jgi:hypothetical protein
MAQRLCRIASHSEGKTNLYGRPSVGAPPRASIVALLKTGSRPDNDFAINA